MITVYRRTPAGLARATVTAAEVPAAVRGALWIDLHQPDAEECRAVATLLGIVLPSAEQMRSIETSDQLYRAGNAHYMTILTVARPDLPLPERRFMTFILTPELLVTVHRGSTTPFEHVPDRAAEDLAELGTPAALLVWLVDQLVERVSALLERIEGDLERMSLDTFGDARSQGRRRLFEQTRLYRLLLRQVGHKGNAVGKSRQSLLTIARMLTYFGHARDPRLGHDHVERAEVVLRDVQGLMEHAGFLSQTIAFLLDAALGMIGIQQNEIIRVFTIVSVLFLPPTLVGTVYGMNFHVMPELDWPWGYPLALLLMVLSAALPYLYARRKGWF